MKKKLFTFSLILLTGTTVVFESCKNDSEDPITPDPEFIADDNTFSGFEQWSLVATKNGVDPANLGMAHAGNDSTSVRKIYFKDANAARVDGEFPVGTVLSKLSAWESGSKQMITAMAKRGNDFDSEGNDWEYFILNADGSILVDGGETKRGANLNNGGCKGCHGKVSNNDYVFSK